jgi:dynein heavy chain
MVRIFSEILGGFLSVVGGNLEGEDLPKLSVSIVTTAVDIYKKIQDTMLPTPSKSHYTFNLRDLSKVVQGICQIDKGGLHDVPQLMRLWMHETARVFRDRLVDSHDRDWFDDMCTKNVAEKMQQEVTLNDDLVFGDYMSNAEPRPYAEVKDLMLLGSKIQEFLDDYNLQFPTKMHLVFFKDAISHLSRIARILRQPRGNALLVGVGGSGRQSLTRLAAFMAGYKCVSIEITRGYSVDDWHEAIKALLQTAGCDNQPVVFLFTDTQVVHEMFLEDINNLLNSGEIPNLFAADELEGIVGRVRSLVKAAGKVETRDNILAHFVQLVRENLHVVLAFSPGTPFTSMPRKNIIIVTL